MNRKTQIYIVHGYTASSEQNWFPWLKTQLANNNINATTFDMPNSNAPDVKEWDEWLDKNIEHYNENTFFVGHSLGCIALLRYLDRHADSQKIGGFVLVSGFLNPVSTLPELDSFVSQEINLSKIIRNTVHRCTIASLNDTIVAYEHTLNLSKQLETKLVTIENGGHFLDRDGFVSFPAVYDEICKMIDPCTV